MNQAKRFVAQYAMVLLLSACLPAPGTETDWLAELQQQPDAAGNISTCYKDETVPAVIDTVTEQNLVTPEKLAADGSIEAPAIYQSQSRHAIVRERREVRIKTPCPSEMTPEFVASLQRALKVRGQFDGAVTGRYDAETAAAVERYQTDRGLPSAILSVDTARELGLIAYSRKEILAGA